MAAFSGNGIYFAIDGTDMSAYFTTINFEPSVEEQDITRGSGTTHRARAAGLKDSKISVTLSYEITLLTTHIQKVAPGVHSIEFGPEGATSGKPRHVQDFLLTTAPFEVSVEKTHVTFAVEGMGAATPSVDITTGAVYS